MKCYTPKAVKEVEAFPVANLELFAILVEQTSKFDEFIYMMNIM